MLSGFVVLSVSLTRKYHYCSKREEISYLVMEAGAWYSDQGKLFQVGRVQTAGANGASWGVGAQQNAAVAGGWTPVTYHTPFADDMVSALTQVQTYVRE